MGIIKHTHHNIELDSPGKDSYQLRKAGSKAVLLTGENRSQLTLEEPFSGKFFEVFKILQCDLVIVEGMANAPWPKLEIHRQAYSEPRYFPEDKTIQALVTDQSQKYSAMGECIDLNRIDELGFWVLSFLEKNRVF